MDIKSEEMDGESTTSIESAALQEDISQRDAPVENIQGTSVEEMDTPEDVNEDSMSAQGESAETTVDSEPAANASGSTSQEVVPEPEQQAKYNESRKIEQAELLNGAALSTPGRKRKTHAELLNLSTRNYLDETVVPTLLVGMSELARSRPEKPLEWLAKHLLAAQDRQDIADGVAVNSNRDSKTIGQGDEDNVEKPINNSNHLTENGKSTVSTS